MKKKLLTIISTITMAIVMFAMPCFVTSLNSDGTKEYLQMTRTIEANNQQIDYESVLNQFENSSLETEGSLTTFEGYKSITLQDLLEIDEVSASDIPQEEMTIKYNFTYDKETNMVTLTATLTGETNEPMIDTISGVAFTNEYGNIDALLDMDGEFILLSEMQNLGMIQNCGWFSRLFKKVAVAVVAVVVVSAVVALTVSTAGAGLGAVIAAGAVAGGVTGAVAGGLISYSEYGKLDWRWVVGGAVIGAALGAVTGWGVGVATGATTNSQVNSLIKASKNGQLKTSQTLINKGYMNPKSPNYRPYYDQMNTISQEIMKAKNPVVEQGTKYLKWTVEGAKGGSAGKVTKGVWELVIDPVKKVVVHFLFKS